MNGGGDDMYINQIISLKKNNINKTEDNSKK